MTASKQCSTGGWNSHESGRQMWLPPLPNLNGLQIDTLDSRHNYTLSQYGKQNRRATVAWQTGPALCRHGSVVLRSSQDIWMLNELSLKTCNSTMEVVTHRCWYTRACIHKLYVWSICVWWWACVFLDPCMHGPVCLHGVWCP